MTSLKQFETAWAMLLITHDLNFACFADRVSPPDDNRCFVQS